MRSGQYKMSQPTKSSHKSRPLRKPDWLRIKLSYSDNFRAIERASRARNLHTVCEEANCPNIYECWNGGTATFMILGELCTRGCRFCSVKTGSPAPGVDPEEPEHTARTVAEMNLSYIVLTSVDRDDLDDQGASHFAQTVTLTKTYSPGIIVETLTPDWRGEASCIQTMVDSEADVLAHNVETVERLQRKVRDARAGYAQSLDVLKSYRGLRESQHRPVLTKSSIMLGLGEKDHEIQKTMEDLLNVGVRVLTIGQYLQPTQFHLPVESYVHPDTFTAWADKGKAMGFAYVASGPLVRSSYRAGEYYIRHILGQEDTRRTKH